MQARNEELAIRPLLNWPNSRIATKRCFQMLLGAGVIGHLNSGRWHPPFPPVSLSRSPRSAVAQANQTTRCLAMAMHEGVSGVVVILGGVLRGVNHGSVLFCMQVMAAIYLLNYL